VIRIKLNFLTPLANTYKRMHWTASSAMNKRVREEILIQIAPIKKLKPPVRIHVTRHSKQRPDHDGLPVCAKFIIDAFVKLGVIPDDSPDIVTELNVDWKYEKGRGFMTAEIDEIVST